MSDRQVKLWTIGHSTRSLDEFLSIIAAYELQVLVDVRTFPGSRRHPHFNQGQLSKSLSTIDVEYRHLPKLGGLRTPSPHSANIAIQNPSFRAYADHIETEDFRQGINELLEIASELRTAIMCAESDWRNCHRSLISDYLKSIGVQTIHILDAERAQEHQYTEAARLISGKLSYRGLLG